mgnify:CR=1 FL=1
MKKRTKKENKGLSPVIATVLLIAVVIVMGLIVFLWMKGSVKEVIYKFPGENIELTCADVSFDAEYINKNLYVVNNGDVPIGDFKVQVITKGTKTTFNLNEDGDVSEINSGVGKEFPVSEKVGDATELLVIPVLRGKTESGTAKDYVCDEDYGRKVFITQG